MIWPLRAIATAALALLAGLVSASEAAVDAGATESERRLQIPLDQTTALRAQFATELHALKGDDLRAFYTGWLDRIGANGIVDTLKRVEPGSGRGYDLANCCSRKSARSRVRSRAPRKSATQLHARGERGLDAMDRSFALYPR